MYALASVLFYAIKEGACLEQSSRMSGMDNASKNAGAMINKLTFNRTRQAAIIKSDNTLADVHHSFHGNDDPPLLKEKKIMLLTARK